LESGEAPPQSGGATNESVTSQMQISNTNAASTMQQLEKGETPMPNETMAQKPVSIAMPTPAIKETPKVKTENVKINLSPVEPTYSGYKIELFTSSASLPVSSEEIQHIGNTILSEIAIDNLKNGHFSYMVGAFLNWSETERFLEKVQTQFNKARIVEYFNGKRIGG
jgi:hypothetical protein